MAGVTLLVHDSESPSAKCEVRSAKWVRSTKCGVPVRSATCEARRARGGSVSIRRTAPVLLAIVAMVGTLQARQAATITTPKEAFGFNFGDDYQLVNYTRLVDYWRR